ncbi:MAG: hypothetical protein ACE5ER_11285 [Nitrospinaceae bacterium]
MSAVILLISLGMGSGRAWAQIDLDLDGLDIDQVMQSLDRDFAFGGREIVKQENLRVTSEAQNEEIQIQREAERRILLDKKEITVSPVSSQEKSTVGSPGGSPGGGGSTPSNMAMVTFALKESQSANTDDQVRFEVLGLLVLNSGLDGGPVFITADLPAGATQTFRVTCVFTQSAFCRYQAAIQSSTATFGSPAPFPNDTFVRTLNPGQFEDIPLTVPLGGAN